MSFRSFENAKKKNAVHPSRLPDADALQRGLQTLSPPPQPSAGNSAGELRRGGRMSSLRARLRACPRACVQFWDRDSPASRSGTLFPRL